MRQFPLGGLNITAMGDTTFEAQPVPEPALLAMGLGAMAFALRRRRRRALAA